MNTFQQVLAAIYNNAKVQFGSAINTSGQGSNSNLFYYNEAENAFIVEQAIGTQQNNLSIYSAQGNNLNGLGNFLNYTYRPYNTISLSLTLTASSMSVTITGGLEVTYTDGFGNIYYFQTSQASDFSSSTVLTDVPFYYVGSIPLNVSSIPIIPAGNLDVIAGSAVISGGTLDSVNNPSSYTPTQISDEQYSLLLQNVYQKSSFGLDGAIQLLISDFDFVTSCKVYIGNIVSGTLVITGTYTYTLPFGAILIIIQYNAPPMGSTTPYQYQVVSNAIFSRIDWCNFTYQPGSPPANQVEVTVTSALGNSQDIYTYLAVEYVANLVLTASATLSVSLNSTQFQNLQTAIFAYLTSIPIAGTLYFSSISQIASQYGLVLSSLTLNGSADTLTYSSLPDNK